MTISLLHFPYLVYDCVVKQMEFYETFSLATCSKRSTAIVRTCLACQKLEVKSSENYHYQLTRKCSDESDTLIVRLKDQSWELLDGDSVSKGFVRIRTNRLDVKNEMLEFIINLFPRLILDLTYFSSDANAFRSTMEITKYVNLGEVKLNTHHKICDEMVKLALENCQKAKELHISRRTSDAFAFDHETHPPFTFDRIFLYAPAWLTKDHFMKLFMTCKCVLLEDMYFLDGELREIFEEWVEGSPMESLQIQGTGGFFGGTILRNVVGHLPGAETLKSAVVRSPEDLEFDYKVHNFQEEKCYLIQQKGGKKALVYQHDESVILSAHFIFINRHVRI